ncbi:YlbD family protein [Lederbergia sp. NSJ-179]|uniref:YlbD family protein n=1 Tax=Lederbergia sp. NSJ-179 TaxID=2931402 RepID=UPI001FD264B7|nr:YlbD family protein [Lederbergia sp. NSJ-179]MCJ7839527.1 YlbD family protein [Lederbergia sp. NSJ-179]
MEKDLHPSVKEFKEFIQQHPHLIKAVRREEYTWQELFEDWYLLGEDDPKWKKENSKEEGNRSTKEGESKLSMGQITKILKNMDVNQLQHHIQQLSQAIGAVQGVLTQFQSQSGQSTQTGTQTNRNNPFSFRKD